MMLPWAASMDVAYVGSYGFNLLQSANLNTVDLGSAFLPQNQDRTLAFTGTAGRYVQRAEFGVRHRTGHDRELAEPERSGDDYESSIRCEWQRDSIAFVAARGRSWRRNGVSIAAEDSGADTVLVLKSAGPLVRGPLARWSARPGVREPADSRPNVGII
jgi:hypothetical protein